METLEACRYDFGPQTVNPEGYMGPASLEQISTNVPVLTVRQLLNPVWSTGQSNMARHLSHRQFLSFAFLHSLVLFHIRALGFLVNFKKSSRTPSQQISFFDLRLDTLVGPQRGRVLSLPRSVSAGTQMGYGYWAQWHQRLLSATQTVKDGGGHSLTACVHRVTSGGG